MERAAKGELIVMEPMGSEGGSYNAEISADLTSWNRQTCLGQPVDALQVPSILSREDVLPGFVLNLSLLR